MKSAILWLVGGFSVGSGVLLAATGGFFSAADSAKMACKQAVAQCGEVAQHFSTLGYDGVDDIALSQQGMMAVTLFIVGAAMMIGANATAWKQTGGY